MSTAAEWVPPGVIALVELFESRAELKFPELDASVLQDAIDEVKRVAGEIQTAEAALERAREMAALRQEGLLVKAQRALAYARVFAEEDPKLSDRLDQISLPRARRSMGLRVEGIPEVEAVAPRRKRANKQSEPLFVEGQPGAISAGT